MGPARLRRNVRGGAILDLVVAFGLIALAAFVLVSFGISFHQLLHGVEKFFGVG